MAPLGGRRFWTLAASLAVSACVWSPQTPPGPPPAADNGRRQGAIAVTVRSGGQPVAGAQLEVSGDGLAAQKPQESGPDGTLAVVGIDPTDSLLLRAEAPGYLAVTRTTERTTLAATGQGSLTVDMVPIGGILSGRAVSAGMPLRGISVSDGQRSTVTDTAGRFNLPLPVGQSTLRLAGTGYVTQSVGPIKVPAAEELGDQTLEPTGRPIRVVVDVTHLPFGRDQDDGPLVTLYALLRGQGFDVVRKSEGELDDLTGTDVLLVPVPGQAYTPAERARLTEWVRQGGKLIVLGEWGGFGGFSLQAANDLLLPFNLAFGADALRTTAIGSQHPGAVPVPAGSEAGLWDGVRQIQVFEACSVRVVDGGAVPLESRNTHLTGRIGARGLRIAAIWGDFSPVGVSVMGAGRVVAIGDSSLWSADDSDGDGTMDLLNADNRTFALNVFRW